MSQQRVRKASAAAEAPQARSSVVKAAGDSGLPNPNHQQQPRSRSKNKIPKNIRYDLDNALVGLCDVWFEDIKPHLIRNKIKVHIHGEGASPASGDHQRVPPEAPGCSHGDPASSAPVCELCRLLFNAANSIESAVSQAASASASASNLATAATPPISGNYLHVLINRWLNKLSKMTKSVQQGCKHAKKHSNPPKSHFMQPQLYRSREPAPSQTYTVFPSTYPRSHYRDMRTAVTSCKKKDAGSQTIYSWPVSPMPVIVKVDKETQTRGIWRRKSSARVVSNIPASFSPIFDRCPGKTTLLPSRVKTRQQLPSTLFNESLIDDVAKADPKLIEVLFQSPNSSMFNSSVTLLDTPKGKRKRKDAGKKPPWR